MKNSILMYLKKPQTILAVVVALMAQIIFCVFWMTGYEGVMERTNQLTIAIVNEDGINGEEILEQFKRGLPFQLKTLSKSQATEELMEREVQMVLTIPKDFSKSLQTAGTQTNLFYQINESNPQLTKNIMQTIETSITNEMNQNVALKGTEMILKQQSLPEDQAVNLAHAIVKKVKSETHSLNPVMGMNNQMVPMMLILASYVGAMMMAMNIHQVAETIGGTLTKWQHYAVRAVIIFAAAIVISLVGSSLIVLLGGQMESSFFLFWLFHFLTVITFMFFAQMFLIVFGMAGMFLNMSILSLQLVASGTIVPREMLSGFYHGISQFLPGTYAVEGFMNLQFGGVNTIRDVWALLVITLATVVVTSMVTILKKQNRVEEKVTHTQLSTN